MFGIFRRDKTSIYDAAMNKVLEDMEIFGPTDPEFEQRLGHLERLTKLKDDNKSKSRVSPDTMALGLFNLAGILVIVMYEQKHVVTTKAKEFSLKLK